MFYLLHSKTKITIIVLSQIALIIGSFLGVAYWESQFSLLGNSVNVAGKNRLLTSQFLNEVKDDAYVKLPDSDPEGKLNELEQNILLLKNGGDQNNFKIDPLREEFNPDWELVYEQFKTIRTDYQDFKLIQSEQNLSPFQISTLEIDSLILINYSDTLVQNMGLLVDESTQKLIVFQITLLGFNVAVHIAMILLIAKIFRNEFELTLQKEKLATVGELSSRLDMI